MEMDIVQVISQVGFPIAVTCYLLYNNTTKNREQIEATNKQTEVLAELRTLIETLVNK